MLQYKYDSVKVHVCKERVIKRTELFSIASFKHVYSVVVLPLCAWLVCV